MKELLTPELVSKLVKGDPSAATCLSFHENVLNGFVQGVVYPRCLILEFPRQRFVEFPELLRVFPSLWWADFSGNHVRSVKLNVGAKAMGKLNLSNNPISVGALSELQPLHILRLHAPWPAGSGGGGPSGEEVVTLASREEFAKVLPLVWVLNDDYIPFKLRKNYIFDASRNGGTTMAAVWDTAARSSDREYNLLLAVKEFPNTAQLMESSRLDVLLEDYLDEAWIYNNYLTRMRSSLPEMPTLNPTKILNLSHAQRLDLSVVLTLSIVIDVPIDIFTDGLQKHFLYIFSVPELENILKLPIFVKTAVVNLIRRICTQEKFELEKYQCLTVRAKTSSAVFSDDFIAFRSGTYLSAGGFRHLFECRKYLEYCPVPNLDLASDRTPFSDLENDILRVLPDVPTRTDATHIVKKGSASSYSDWVSFVGRHTVVLLRRAMDLPSLTRVPSSQAEQQVYMKLLPVLQIAKMSYDDLDIANTGATLDGRVAAKGSSKIHLGTNLLAYGAGIPDGAPKQLVWNKTTVESKLVTSRRQSTSKMTDDLPSDHVGKSELDLNSVGNQDINFTDATTTYIVPDEEVASTEEIENALDECNIPVMSEAVSGSLSLSIGACMENYKEPGPSILSPKPVSGFSSDLHLGPAFILAPERAIEKHNEDVSEALDGWRPLQIPPVFVQPVEASSFKDLAPQLGGSPSPMDTKQDTFENTKGRFNEEQSMNDDGTRSVLFEYSVDSGNDVSIKYDETLRGLNFIRSQPFSPSAKVSAQTSAAGSAASKHDSAAGKRVQFSADPMDQGVKFTRQDPVDAAKELLKEMGTFRNLRNLAKFNKDHAPRAHNSGKSVQEESSIITTRLTTSLDGNSWIRQFHLRAKQLTADKPDEFKSANDAFLTSLQDDDEANDERGDELVSKVSSTEVTYRGDMEQQGRSLNYHVNTSYGTKFPLLKSTVVQQARASFNYPFVYSNEGEIERGVIASSGKQISPHWFPRQEKVVYRIQNSMPPAESFGLKPNDVSSAQEDRFQQKLMKALPSESPVRYISKTRHSTAAHMSLQSDSRVKQAKAATVFRGRGLPSERVHMTPGHEIIDRLVKANQEYFSGMASYSYIDMTAHDEGEDGLPRSSTTGSAEGSVNNLMRSNPGSRDNIRSEGLSKAMNTPFDSRRPQLSAPVNVSTDPRVVTPAPVFRGVEGSATEGLYGDSIDALSVFRPASARLELNRGFKLMKNRPPDVVVVAGQKIQS